MGEHAETMVMSVVRMATGSTPYWVVAEARFPRSGVHRRVVAKTMMEWDARGVAEAWSESLWARVDSEGHVEVIPREGVDGESEA